ncbi:MAG: ABC transporter substrate-binding protein [Burkholderiaceae bacterium]
MTHTDHSTGRRALLIAGGALAAPLPSLAQPRAGAPQPKVLRYAFPVAETGFDPVQISDLYSRIVTAHIFEAPLKYDYLARPYKLKPNTAATMPEVSPDYRTFVIRLRPGIYFADDPAFKGRPRELTADDYVYSWKRFYDPRWKAPYVAVWILDKLLGLNEYREEVLKTKQAFDYDRPIEGLRALDRYTIEIRLAEPNPRFLYSLATPDVNGAVAREVVDFYGDKIMEHPVGTGPFRLAEWRRSSRIVLEPNPGFRDVRYDETPNADDAEGQELERRYRGRKLPLVDRVEISIVEENQPRYLAFVGAEHDVLYGTPLDFANLVVPGGRLAPHLARRGIRLYRTLAADVTMTVYNMDDPVIGGYTPERIALRRAINLGIDIDREIRLLRRGQAIAAQSPLMPQTYGYDPDYRSEMGQYDLARARALLDMYGFVDRDGDGFREQPDGAPLRLVLSTQPDQISRQFDELFKKNMEALGLRLDFSVAKWPEQLRQARAGKFMMWGVGLSAASPDGQGVLARGYSLEIGGQNLARFKLPEFDRIYERLKVLPDGPERLELFRRANAILIAYAPYKFHVHRIINDLAHPWVSGFRRPPFWLEWWQYVDIDPLAQARAVK